MFDKASFESYEFEFKNSTNDVNGNIKMLKNEDFPERQRNLMKECLQKMNFAETQIKLMSTEAGSLSMSEMNLKMEIQSKIEKYRRDYRELESKLDDYRKSHRNIGLDELYGEGNQRLLKTTNMLSDGVENLKIAKARAYEADQYGIDITRNLQGQSEQMKNGINKLKNVEDELSWGNKLINEMNRRRISNKVILYGVGLLILLGLAVVLYFAIKKNSDDEPNKNK